MTEIVVVGAGFVGLSFALAAQGCGFDVEVHDLKPKPAMPKAPSAQVIAVNPASADFLADTGAWQHLEARFRPAYTAMSVFDGEGAGAINFTAEEAGLPVLGHIVDQAALLAGLCAEAAAQDLKVHWQTAAEVESLSAPLIVAADGAHSRTRERLGLKKVGFAYGQRATTCLVETENPHGNRAFQWFRESGPLALLPLGEDNSLALVWSSSEDLSAWSGEAFVERLGQVSEGRLGRILSVSPRASFPLIQQQALRYVAKGVALLGDAAHAIHPLAGQGANLGFADARALAREVAAARLEGRSPGDLEVLKRYQRERRLENYLAAAAMEGFHRLFTSRRPLVGLLRSRGLGFVDKNTLLKQLATGVASGRTLSRGNSERRPSHG